MKNNVEYLKKHYNNFIYPKPTEDINKDYLEKNRRPISDPEIFWHRLFPEKPYSNKKLNILIAGCGSHEAAILAKFNKKHEFVGIDLSANSILHQENLKKKHSINNLTLICNDFRKESFKKSFDYIISAGVIHHLEEPGSALDYFNTILKDDGVISLMVYGDKINYALNQVKLIFKSLDLSHDKESIDFARDFFNSLNKNHPAKVFANSSRDLDFDAGVVDFCLHQFEKFFSIKELINLLKKHNFIIKNLNVGKIFALTKYFLGAKNNNYLNRIRKLNVEEQWQLGQILNWDDRKISIVCTKNFNLEHSIAYNRDKFEDLYIGKNPECIYEIKDNKLVIRSGKEIITIDIIIGSNKIWDSILSGKHKTKFFFLNLSKNESTFYRETLDNLIENYLLDLSFCEINYPT